MTSVQRELADARAIATADNQAHRVFRKTNPAMGAISFVRRGALSIDGLDSVTGLDAGAMSRTSRKDLVNDAFGMKHPETEVTCGSESWVIGADEEAVMIHATESEANRGVCFLRSLRSAAHPLGLRSNVSPIYGGNSDCFSLDRVQRKVEIRGRPSPQRLAQMPSASEQQRQNGYGDDGVTPAHFETVPVAVAATANHQSMYA